MEAVSAVSSTSDVQTELVRYQQKLAADLAAKAAARVITADKAAIAKAEQAAQQVAPASPATAATASAVGSTFDVTA